MFGYVAANPKMMNEQQTERYRCAYCGLCRTLGKRHGELTRLSLTYDMTFLSLFLGGLYEPEEQNEQFRCLMHPKGKHTGVSTVYTEYAADMNVLLAYLNCLDNWKDDKNVLALMESAVFKKGYREAAERYPRQARMIGGCMKELAQLEAQKCDNPDLPANCFGKLLGELFVYDERDYWANYLCRFGFYLGKFIYLYDAVMDFDHDKQHGSYNPLVLRHPEGLTEAQARELLTLYITPCTEIFEHLPIVKDSDLIQNVLYSGVWQQFDGRYKKKADNGSTEE